MQQGLGSHSPSAVPEPIRYECGGLVFRAADRRLLGSWAEGEVLLPLETLLSELSWYYLFFQESRHATV